MSMNMIDELTGFTSIGVLGRAISDDGVPWFDAGNGWTEATTRNLLDLRYDVRHWTDGPLSPAQRADFSSLVRWAQAASA